MRKVLILLALLVTGCECDQKGQLSPEERQMIADLRFEKMAKESEAKEKYAEAWAEVYNTTLCPEFKMHPSRRGGIDDAPLVHTEVPHYDVKTVEHSMFENIGAVRDALRKGVKPCKK